MKHHELLRLCADNLEKGYPLDLILVWPHGRGRFPFVGGGTELLSANTQGTAYCVPVSRILTAIGKAVKAV